MSDPIDTEALRRRARPELANLAIHKTEGLLYQQPSELMRIANEIDRLRDENARLLEAWRTAMRQAAYDHVPEGHARIDGQVVRLVEIKDAVQETRLGERGVPFAFRHEDDGPDVWGVCVGRPIDGNDQPIYTVVEAPDE